MRFSWIVSLAVASVLLLCSATAVTDATSKGQKRFVPFEVSKVEAGSIINVPIQCPPDRQKIGNRCRAIF